MYHGGGGGGGGGTAAIGVVCFLYFVFQKQTLD
jgi:hypothetical protein